MAGRAALTPVGTDGAPAPERMRRTRCRRRAAWGTCLLALLGIGAPGCSDDASANAAPTAAPSADTSAERDAAYRSDPRVQDLLAECTQEYYYDRDTSDMVPVLVEKLQKGYTEPLQRAKDELAHLGPEAIEAVRRLAEVWYTDPRGSSYAQNALDVAVMSDQPEARDILLLFLKHPREAFRRAAVRGLALGHVRAEDYDQLWFLLEAETPALREQIAGCLHRADPGRAEELFLSWIEQGSYAHLWPIAGPLLAASERPETARACSRLFPVTRLDVRPFLAACAARAGDEAARESLREELLDDSPLQRGLAAQACACAKLADLLLVALVRDPDASVRRIALEALATVEPTGEITARIEEALSDPDRENRLVALQALVDRGDPAATDRALAMLDEDVHRCQEALAAMRDRLDRDPVLAKRAFDRLVAMYESIGHLPLEKRFPVLKLIGSIPGRASAKFLRDAALSNPGRLSSRRVHELLMIQAANSGPEGRAWLFDQLAAETDPHRRLDLIWAASSFRTDAARERLHGLLADPELDPYEILFASELLARLGPSQEVASVLKRICYRIDQDDVRNGMRCLLWKWY